MVIGRGYVIPMMFIDAYAFTNKIKVLYKVKNKSKYKTLRKHKYVKRLWY